MAPLAVLALRGIIFGNGRGSVYGTRNSGILVSKHVGVWNRQPMYIEGGSRHTRLVSGQAF